MNTYTVDKGGHGHYEEIWKWFCEHERNNKTVVCIYIKFRNQVANDEPMNLLILRVRGQRSRPSLTSMEILVNVMNSEFSSSFGSHLHCSSHNVCCPWWEVKLENARSLIQDWRSRSWANEYIDMLHDCMLCVVFIISILFTNWQS